MQKGRRSLARARLNSARRAAKDHFIVEIDLVGTRAWACLRHRVHRVIPARALCEVEPVWRPAEVGRVDVRGEAFLKAVQLVCAAEMHLAAENRLIAAKAQVMREGWDLRGKLCRVVVSADRRRQTARHEGEARRRAQRAVAVGGGEYDAVLGEPIQMRCFCHPVAVRRQRRRARAGRPSGSEYWVAAA